MRSVILSVIRKRHSSHIGFWKTPVKVLTAKESVEYHKKKNKNISKQADYDEEPPDEVVSPPTSSINTSNYKDVLGKAKISESVISSLTGVDFKDMRQGGEQLLSDELSKLKRLRQQKASRAGNKPHRVVLEGRNLVRDALQCGVRAECMFLSAKGLRYLDDLDVGRLAESKLCLVSERAMERNTDVTTHPGLIGIFRAPAVLELDCDSSRLPVPLTVLCDEVRLPDNVAAILRSAVAAGASRVIMAPGCCDVWERKVLRGAAGAHFRIPIIQDEPWSNIHNYLTRDDYQIYICDNSGSGSEGAASHSSGCTSLYQVNFAGQQPPRPICLVLGNESRGVSAEAWRIPGSGPGVSRLYIPMMNRMESVNVAHAATICCFEIQRQILQQLQQTQRDKGEEDRGEETEM